MGKLRFATAIRDFSRRKGGAERYLVDLCARMTSEDFEVHVYAEHWEEEVEGIHFHRVETIPFPKSARLLSFAVRATKAIERGNYDVTLGVGNTLKADVLQPHGGVHWAWFWRSLSAYDHPILWMIKFIVRVLSPKQWINGYIEDAPYKNKRCNKIIAISDMVKRDMIRWYGIPENRIAIIYNGVDIERFHPRNGQYREEIRARYGIGHEFLILFISNNFRMKGLGYLIKALADIKQKDYPLFRLLVLGRDRKNLYLRMAKKLGISERVIFVGSTDEPEKYYGAADLLVHPSFYDACSLSVLEALASGLPVVTTYANGAMGMVDHGEDGWVVKDPKDLDEITEGILYFVSEAARHHASNRGRRKMESHSEEVNFSRMMKIFRETIQDRSYTS